MRRSLVINLTLVMMLSLGSPGLLWADLITNGSFETTSTNPLPASGSVQISDNPSGPDSSNSSYITVNGWARGGPNSWIQTATGNTIMDGPNTGVNNGLGASPDGGNYLAIEGAASFQSSVSQTVTGLTSGVTYQLQFYDGAGQQTGVPIATLTDRFVVSFGSQTQNGPVYTTTNGGFSGWFKEKLDFVANSSSEVLTFTAEGSPNLAPYMVLDGVSLNPLAAPVPEPSTFALAGLGGIVLAIGAYRRRRAAV